VPTVAVYVAYALHSEPYIADSEGGICPTDARFGINWPLEISEMSARDANHPRLDASFVGVTP
jgi:dTDP-4-dehydrorhamnose 3,5-epimerase